MYSNWILTGLILFGICYKFTKADLPPEIEKCHAGDGDCIAKTLEFIFKTYTHGIPEIGLTDIEQLSLNDVVISKANPKSPVSINLEFKKMHLHGLCNSTFQRIVGFEEDLLKSKFEVYATIPNLIMDGSYVSSGKVLILPMDAAGYAKIQLKNVKLSLKIKVNEERKDNKQYGKVKGVKSKLVPELMHMEFENLFKGNKELSASLNQLINDNWKTLWTDMEPQANEVVVRIVNQMLGNILPVLPYDEFYRKD